MSNSITIFVSGISGVFVGMGFLWFFTTMTSIITDKLEQKKVTDQPAQDKEEKK